MPPRKAKSTVPLTPAEQLEKTIAGLKVLQNRLLSFRSFGKIHTLRDMLIQAGHQEGVIDYAYPKEQLLSLVATDTIKSFVHNETIKAHADYYSATHPFTYPTTVTQHTYEGIEFPHTNAQVAPPESVSFATPSAMPEQQAETTRQAPIAVTHEPATSTSQPTDEEEKERDAHTAKAVIARAITSGCYTISDAGQSAELFNFQDKAAAELCYSVMVENKRGVLLNAPVGTGKTYMFGKFLRRILNSNFLHNKTHSPYPIIVVTKATIVEQTIRVLKNEFGLDTDSTITVINIDQLRAKFGAMFVTEQTIVERGEEHIVFKWKANVFPALIIWDECQVLKNEDSTQSKIAQSYNNIDSPNTWQIFSSATAFTRVSEAKCFTVATRLRYTFGVVHDAPMSNLHWPEFSKAVASPADPNEHSPAAMGRLMEYVIDYVVDVKNVRPKHRAHNNVELIDFETKEEQAAYDLAWERYLAEKAKLDEESPEGRFAILVQFLKFRQAAELIRSHTLAKRVYEAVSAGMVGVLAVNFKHTIKKVVKILYYDYNVTRDQISIIWGGGEDVKKKKKQEEENAERKPKVSAESLSEFKQNLIDAGLSTDGFDLDDIIEEYEKEESLEATKDNPLMASDSNYPSDEAFEKEILRLGKQSKKDRQKEIDKLQMGQTDYCLFTFKSGGVGLSLHHSKKHNGRDVIKGRPRRVYLSPTYSAIELVQGLGRCPRLTSESETFQTILFYRHSIEMRVALITSQKLKCLKKVVRSREHWEDVIIGAKGGDDEAVETVAEVPGSAVGYHEPAQDSVEPPTDTTPPDDDDDFLIGGGGDGEDDDE